MNLQTGGIYSIYNGDDRNSFGVIKVLVLEPSIVHIRVYQNTFPTRPDHVDISQLSLGRFRIKDLQDEAAPEAKSQVYRFGIGHMPVSLRDFLSGWQPVFLLQWPVTNDELQGYNQWKENNGGFFGGL